MTKDGGDMRRGETEDRGVRFQVTGRREWEGFPLYQGAVRREGRETPAVLLLPGEGPGAHPCVVAIHGFEDRKETWLDLEGYTKGGRVSRGLLRAGIALMAVDMYGHGAQREEGGYSGPFPALLEEQWETFYARTRAGIEDALAYVEARADLDPRRIGLLSYSLGGVFAFALAGERSDIAVVAACVPPAFREDDDEYAPHNHVAGLSEVPVLIVGATQDEELDLADVQWLYEQLPGERKRFVMYESGHSLPAAYAEEVVAWFSAYL
jgi:dienelactone hydrolase